MVSEQLCIGPLLKTIQKLKAGISALIEVQCPNKQDKQKIIDVANSLYYSNQIIFESQNDRLDFRKHNEFYDFMELDDRKTLKQGGKIGDDALSKID